MKIEAYKCTHTGKLFEFKHEYKKHLSWLASKRRADKKKQEALDKFES